MAKSKMTMPQSSAGISGMSADQHSRFRILPGHVVALIIFMIILVGALHYFGKGLF